MEEGERFGALGQQFLAQGERKQAYTMFMSAASALHRALEKETDPMRLRALKERTVYYLDQAETLAPQVCFLLVPKSDLYL